MSRELPVWDDSETDILPEFRLTYGHTLIQGRPEPAAILERVGLKILESQPMRGDELPIGLHGHYEFQNSATAYTVVAVDDAATCVFADRKLFLTFQRWLALSNGHTIALVTQQQRSEFFYSVFQNQKLVASAVRESGKLRIIGRSKAELVEGGTTIAKSEINPEAPTWTQAFLAADMFLSVTGDSRIKVRDSQGRGVEALLWTVSF